MTISIAFLALVPQQSLPASAPTREPGSVWDRLQLVFDGRFTAEATIDQPDADDRFRGRVRGRLDARFPVTDGLDFEARLSTSSDGNDANNPFWDLGDGDGFNGSDAVVDRFFLDWRASEELDVRGGKMPHALATPPIYGEFVWDQDVQPGGLAVLWTPRTSGDVGFDARAAAYVATEVADDDDPKVVAAQGNLYLPLSDQKQVQVSTSLYDWRDLDEGTPVAGNQGNTDVTDDFLIWESFASIHLPGGPLDEITGFVELFENLQQSSDDTGFVLGGQLGPNSGKGNYNAFLLLYDLEADCLFSPVSQDDTPFPGTGSNADPEGMSGVILGGTYFWRDNVALRVWVLTSDADESDDPIRLRFDLDFNVK